jgi:hypothetical protein
MQQQQHLNAQQEKLQQPALQQVQADAARSNAQLSRLPSQQRQWLHQVAWQCLLKPASPRAAAAGAFTTANTVTAAAAADLKPFPDPDKSVGHSAPHGVPQSLFDKLRKYAMVYLTWRRNQPLGEMLTQDEKWAALQQEEEVSHLSA